MNGKASVSKELNARHTKILEGLLRLPENRECADCWSRAPRWASVNLGMFICMQCSGFHRSLGVHISQVRSTTLDTWLPEQVAFMESMGNEKSNSYWEAELPPDYDRSGIEQFIRAKYVEKRWASRKQTQPTPVLGELRYKNDNLAEGATRSGIPSQTRRLSLDETCFTNRMTQPATRTRRVSLDMAHGIIALTPPTGQFGTSINKPNGAADLFSLLCVHDMKPDTSTQPPSSWATFD